MGVENKARRNPGDETAIRERLVEEFGEASSVVITYECCLGQGIDPYEARNVANGVIQRDRVYMVGPRGVNTGLKSARF